MKLAYKVVSSLIIMWLVVGCASPEPVTQPVEPAAAPPAGLPVAVEEIEQVEVTIGTFDPVGEDSETTRRFLAQVELFKRSHPHIKIVPTEWEWQPEEIADDLETGNIPDILLLPATPGKTVIDDRYLADITALMNTWSVTQEINETILAPFSRSDRLYGIPQSIYIMGLFYDKHLFEEAGLVDSSGEPVPPTTWDEFVVTAKAIKEKTGQAGFCILTKHNQGGWNFMNWGWQAGGEFLRQENNQWQAVFDEPPIVEALQFVKDLRWKHNVLQDNLSADAGDLFLWTADHKCGMAMYALEWFEFIIEVHDGNEKDIGLTILPAGPAGHVNLMGGLYNAIRVDLPPEVQQAAFEWVTWRHFSQEALEQELKTAGSATRWTFHTRRLMYKPNSEIAKQERELLDKYRNMPHFPIYIAEAAKYARPEPPVVAQELYAVLDAVIQAVLEDENADPQTLLTTAAQKFQTEHLDTE